MKLLVVLSAIAAVALARPGFVAPVQQQYHAQDELGQYTYGYSGGPSVKVESRTADGITRGAYSYIDSNGIVQNVNYQADPVNGFRVAASNLPVAPAPIAAVSPVAAVPAVVAGSVVDTPEVAAAKAEHLAIKAVADAKAVAAVPAAVIAAAPLPVPDTPEVAVEKARHLAIVAAVRNTVVDDSAITDDGSYKINPYEDDGEYRGEVAQVVVAQSPVGPVAAVVSDDDSALHDDGSYKISTLEDDGSYKINPLEDDGSYKGEVVVVGTNLVNTLTPAKFAATYIPQQLTYSSPSVTRYAVGSPIYSSVPYSVVPSVLPNQAIQSQYHAQDELGQYSYGYTAGPSSKQEVKTADGVTRGGYSYIDANGIVQSVSYISDPVNGFRVAATNLPVAPQ